MQLDSRFQKFLRDYRGMCNEEASMIELNSSAIYPVPADAKQHRSVIADRCKVRVPYAGTSICFEILFEGADVFDIIVDQQFNDFTPSLDEVPSLFRNESGSSSSRRLISAVQELCAAFKRYSLQKLQSLASSGSQIAARIIEQLNEISTSFVGGFESKQIEVAFTKNGTLANGNGEWGVFIQIKQGFLEQTVKTLIESRSGQTQSTLWKHETESSTISKRKNQAESKPSPKHSVPQETVAAASASRNSTSEFGSIDIEELLPVLRFELRVGPQNDTLVQRRVTIGCERLLELVLSGAPLAKSIGTFHFPSQSLLDYTQHFASVISSRIEQSLTTVSRKRDFMAALCERFGSSVIECDVDTFSTATFLIGVDFDSPSVLLTVQIQRDFPHPKDPPLLQLVCVSPFTGVTQYAAQQNAGQALSGSIPSGGIPPLRELRDYPYSPRWTPAELADRIRTYLNEAIPDFLSQFTRVGNQF